MPKYPIFFKRFLVFLFLSLAIHLQAQIVLPHKLLGNFIVKPGQSSITLNFELSIKVDIHGNANAKIIVHHITNKTYNPDADSIVIEGQLTRQRLGFQIRNPKIVFQQKSLMTFPQEGWFEFEKLNEYENGSWKVNWYQRSYPADFAANLFNSTILYEAERNSTASFSSLALSTSELNKLFETPFSYHVGELRHRSCTGATSVFKTELFLEEDQQPIYGRRRMGVFRFVIKEAGGSMSRASFITMRVWVSRSNNGVLFMETESFSDKHRAGNSNYYIPDGNYTFTIVDPTKSEQLISGFMRGPSGSRGQFSLKKEDQQKIFPVIQAASPTAVLDSIRNQLAVLKGDAPQPQPADFATHNPSQPDVVPVLRVEPETSSSVDFDEMAMQLVSLKQLSERKNDTLHRIRLPQVDSFFVLFYDNAIYDGDSISVFVNDELYIHKAELSQKPIELILSKELGKVIVIKMLAENLGEIPPNTAVMVIRSRERIQSFPMRSDLTTNGSVIITLE